MFSEKELKLARLALNAQSPDGEWTNAALKFFSLLRSRGTDFATEFESAGNGQMAAIPATQPDFGLTFMPWGQYRGQMFKNIPPGWLMAKRDWIRSAPDIMAKWGNIAEAIDKFLGQ
jgi:hypothetical protein